MWVSRKAYQDIQDALVKAQVTATAEVVAARALKESLNWLMLRVTALEKERAVLLERVLGIKVAVPELSSAPTVVHDPFAESAFSETMSFEPMSEIEAKTAGVEWDEEGRVRYTK